MSDSRIPASESYSGTVYDPNELAQESEPALISERDLMDSTETIDMDKLFTDYVTTSGSFNVAEEIWATTLGKMLQALPIPALLIDNDIRISAANQAWGKISSEYKKIQCTPFSRLFPDIEAVLEADSLVQEVFRTRRPRVWMNKLSIDGNQMWGRMTFRSLRIIEERFVMVLVEDLTSEVTQLSENRQLQKRLQEQATQLAAEVRQKELLLRELHHRVKNNLQVLTSIVAIQRQYVAEPVARSVLGEMADRIHSMALIHEERYRSENLSASSAKASLGALADHLFSSYASFGSGIDIVKDIEDLYFGIDTAIPVGMILTELVSNCLKHAFPNGRTGQVAVSLRSLGQDQFELVVADNGVGMPDYLDPKNPKSLGLDLVDSFVRQLHGTMEIRRRGGTQVRVRFSEVQRKKRTQNHGKP